MQSVLALHHDAHDELAVRLAGQPVLDAFYDRRPEHDGWAIITFILITYNKIKFGGIKGYLKGFLEPIFVMAPLNVLSEIATPVSMSFRHFGNMAGGLVITTLIMGALKVLSNAVLGFLPVPLLQIGLPGVLSLYFDCFTACMQAFIFSMLTMAYVGDARGS